MKCYEILQCSFCGTEHSSSKCPPHKNKIGCWEYDWVRFYKKLPEGEEKSSWRKTMLAKCPECQVYGMYKNELNKILKELAKS